MAATYPAGVPTCPLRGSFTNEPVNTVLTSSIEGLPQTRNRHTGKLCKESWKIRMNDSQLDTLLDWYHNTLKKVLPFDYTDPVSQVSKEYFFVSPPSSVHVGGNHFVVTFDLDMTL